MATVAKAPAPPPVGSVDVTSAGDPFLTLLPFAVKGFEQPRGGACRALFLLAAWGPLQETGSWRVGRERVYRQRLNAFPGVGDDSGKTLSPTGYRGA